MIAWSALPDCKVSISLEFPEIVQLLIQPIELHLTLTSFDVPLMTKSWLPPVAVDASPCVNVSMLESPVASKSKSEFATSPVAPTANVPTLLSPVAL